MTVFGEIIIVLAGLVIFLWSAFVTYFLSKLQQVGYFFLLPMLLGVVLMWIGIHYGPITVGVGG